MKDYVVPALLITLFVTMMALIIFTDSSRKTHHRIDIHRDCEVLNTFMTSDGRRFYCAPWVEEPTTPTPHTDDQETQA